MPRRIRAYAAISSLKACSTPLLETCLFLSRTIEDPMYYSLSYRPARSLREIVEEIVESSLRVSFHFSHPTQLHG